MSHLQSLWMADHLLLAPILLPLLVAASMMMLSEERHRLKMALNVGSCAVLVLVCALLLIRASYGHAPHAAAAYLPGNWQAPFGIALVLDRLSALMLLLTSVVGLSGALFACARWHRVGVHFHPLYQLQLMGLAGAFLTGDLFNLFVFFEVTLAASYGLLLHGSGRARVLAGMHYIAVNLFASALFLIGVSMLYGITGTLNMADLAQHIPTIRASDRGLLHATAGLLATAFLIKAAVWPLNFWLVPAYSAATAPVAALFALMTKLGVYAILRLWTLVFGMDAGVSAQFGALWLVGAGLVTMGFGAIGMLGSQRLGHLAGYAALLSSGTVLAATGFGENQVTAGMLYYLPGSTLAISALFLLGDVLDRWRSPEDGADPYEPAEEVAPFLNAALEYKNHVNLDENEEIIVGRPIPAATAFVGLAFLACTLMLSGMPPLSGFVGKFAMLSALLNPLGLVASTGHQLGTMGWIFMAMLIGCGFLALTALVRAGIAHFWSARERRPLRLGAVEGLPIGVLVLCCALLAAAAGPALRYTQNAANALHAPQAYIQAVLGAEPVPSEAAGANMPADDLAPAYRNPAAENTP